MKEGLKIKAFLLLHSILGVQILSVGCMLSNYIHHLSHDDHSSKHHQEHHHEHHDDSIHETNNETEKESCCSESSSIFLSAVEAIPSINYWIKAPYSFQHVSFFYERVENTCVFEVIVMQIRPPPLTVINPSLSRIIIQSFQI